MAGHFGTSRLSLYTVYFPLLFVIFLGEYSEVDSLCLWKCFEFRYLILLDYLTNKAREPSLT